MNLKSKQRRDARERRRARLRRKIRGTAERPRLVVNDDLGVTLLGVSTRVVDGSAATGEMSGKIADAWVAGKTLAEKAVSQGIEAVVFDRGGYPYHGRVKAFAEGARAGGLRF